MAVRASVTESIAALTPKLSPQATLQDLIDLGEDAGPDQFEAALGAYMVDRRTGHAETRDGRIESLLDLAHEEGLSGYVMFEILGPHRPERARAAPPEVHRAIVRYVERYVLGQREAPEGVYNARLSLPPRPRGAR